LDEVDALPLTLQSKLLTALESKQVRRLGAVAGRLIDVKLIAATNAVLPQQVAAGRFRADLYHRLAVVVLALPPVRTRGEMCSCWLRPFCSNMPPCMGCHLSVSAPGPRRGSSAMLGRAMWAS